MFFLLARLRAFAFIILLLSVFGFAREDSLFTSSVTYCEPPETLLIQRFDLAYFASNQSITFNISAASVQENVNVSANVLLNVYGLHPVNLTLDLCSLFGGALCPLPMYNFTGSTSLSLPKSLGVADRIPGIAFKIPDLEGVAQLVLTEVGTGDVKACVQATLSNGWSTHQLGVEWATGGIAIFAALLAIWHSFSPDSIFPFRFLELLFLYQSIAATSFLNLNYPSTYRAFTLNFAWAMGLISSASRSSIQAAVDNMRHLTGGKLADATSESAVGYVNRKLSPYNLLGDTAGMAVNLLKTRTAEDDVFDFSWLPSFALADPSAIQSFKNLATDSSSSGVQTVTSDSSNVLQAGIPIYVNSLHIATANAFTTIFLIMLILLAILLVAASIGYAILFYMRKQGKESAVKFDYWAFVKSWSIRLLLFIFSPVMIFSFYQWTLKDSWLAILLSVITFLAVAGSALYLSIMTVLRARRSSSEMLYIAHDRLASDGPLFNQYRVPYFFFFIPLLFASFLKSIFIAFAKGNGEVQIILVVILEGLVVVFLLVFRPYKTRGADVFSTFLAISRLVCSGLTIAFIEKLNVAPIPRVVIGLVIAVITSVTVLITYINLVINSGIERLWKRGSSASSSSGSTLVSEKEKDKESSASEHEKEDFRPYNPTPQQNIPLDSQYLQPYPVSPTVSDTVSPTTTDHPSINTRDSGTITVGSLLPRRWSFTPLSSPAHSSQVHGPPSPYSPVGSDQSHPYIESRRLSVISSRSDISQPHSHSHHH